MHEMVQIKKKSFGFFLFFIVLLIYQSLAFFKIAPVESDGNGFANGSSIMLQSKWGNNWAAYSFASQSGTYAVINLLSRATGLKPLASFSILSSICSVIFVVVSSLLISKVISMDFSICGLGLLLFQESITGGYYANSNVIASIFIITSLYLVSINGGKLYEMIIIGVLIGIGAWIRFDSIMIAPAIIFLLYLPLQFHFREIIKILLTIFIFAFIVILSALYGSGSSISLMLANAAGHFGSEPVGTQNLGIPMIGGADIKSYLSYFSALLAFLILFGIIEIIKTKKWILLGFIVSGIVPFFLVYSGTITTPKYMYYLLPFWGLLAALGFSRVVLNRSKTLWGNTLLIVLALLSLQYIIGFRATFKSKPYINDPNPTLIKIFSLPLTRGPISSFSIVVGPGSMINTADGDRLSSGFLFAPIVWINNKNDLEREISSLSSIIANSRENVINLWADDYGGRQLALNILLDNKFLCVPDITGKMFAVCKDNSQTIFLYYLDNQNRGLDQIMTEMKSVSLQNIIFITNLPWKQYLIPTNQPDWDRLTSFAYVYKALP